MKESKEKAGIQGGRIVETKGEKSTAQIEELLRIMARLRDPDEGCPWDRVQNFHSIAPYTIEEAYEVLDAIERNDLPGLRDELGDLLLQVVFHAQMAEEQGAFDFSEVVASICQKMTRRHPHVFGNEDIADVNAQRESWEALKAQERQERASKEKRSESVLDDISLALPGLTRAVKLQKRAARVGFDWPDLEPVIAKIKEELAEVEEVLAEGRDKDRLEDELGDLFFCLGNLARHLKIDPEAAVRRTNAKFERRFKSIEAALREQGTTPEAAGLELMDELWNRAKAAERG